MTNTKTHASAITQSLAGRTFPHPTKASWGCSEGTWYAFETADYTKAKVLEIAQNANDTQVMLLRLIGVIMAWVGVYCILYPIVAMADIMGDCLEWIPCVGDMLSNIVEGMVTCVICMVSCSSGTACALFTIAIVWVVMRPLVGLGLMAICILLFVLAGYVMKQFHDPEKASKKKRRSEIEMGDVEADG